jgi:hypothetical protein
MSLPLIQLEEFSSGSFVARAVDEASKCTMIPPDYLSIQQI